MRNTNFHHKRWLVKKTNEDYIKYLMKVCCISYPLAQILINRGIKTPDAVSYFIEPTLAKLYDPFEIKGIQKAKEIIVSAIKSGKKILIHGDYDTDGLTATAIMVITLKRIGADVIYFIPHRLTDGYGFNNKGVEYAKKLGVSLIITVDCGISSHKTVKMAKENGISVVITDHHEPLRDDKGKIILPEAEAIVNPLLSNENKPNISGSTVALKLAMALLGIEETIDFFDLACLGTIADMVPLVGDSRVIAKEGLKIINTQPRVGIKALKDVSSIKNITAKLLSFTLIPRINASGRIDNAEQVIKLFLTEDYEEAILLAKKLNDLNMKRQQIEEEVFQEAVHIVQKKGYEHCIIVASEGWHEGVVGIVASRLMEIFYRPTFVMKIMGDITKGSARSIPPFDIYSGLCNCKDILLSFGGHRQAAGVTLKTKYIKEFEKRMNKIIKQSLTQEEMIPFLTIDASIALKDVNFSLVNEISKLEPFGYGNPEPLFGTKAMEVINPRIVGNNHLKMFLKHNSIVLDAIGFEMGNIISTLKYLEKVDAVYTPIINEWEGNKLLQLRLYALRESI